MVRTIKPYGAVNEREIFFIGHRFSSSVEDFVPVIYDQYGIWEITPETYEELFKRGFKQYERKKIEENKNAAT